jgi:hypothetical protein
MEVAKHTQKEVISTLVLTKCMMISSIQRIYNTAPGLAALTPSHISAPVQGGTTSFEMIKLPLLVLASHTMTGSSLSGANAWNFICAITKEYMPPLRSRYLVALQHI